MAPSSAYAIGDVVPFHLSPGIVVASFFVSLIGAVTTFELLQRRKYDNRWRNRLHLGACACLMGLIAIWCMHYIGNLAFIMGDGENELQLLYHPGYTALSSIIPIITLFVAFYIADHQSARPNPLPLLFLTGIFAGSATVGMHYIATLGIANYSIEFDPKYIAGAIIIACIAGIGGLSLTFIFRELWINAIPVRVFCAFIFASTVSSLHFEASAGIKYRLRQLSGTVSSRETSTIIAIVLTLITIPVCVAITVSTARRQKEIANNAKHVILACVRFSPDGRLMVTHEGMLPCGKMYMAKEQTLFDEGFDNTHPAFEWIFRVSYNWQSIVRYLPNMRQHLNEAIFAIGAADCQTHLTRSNVNSVDEAEEYSVLFRESFCIAASDLAEVLKEQIEDIGTLYEHVITTGTPPVHQYARRNSVLGNMQQASRNLKFDVEKNLAIEVFGTGKILLLVKGCAREDLSRYEDNGYRFLALEKITNHLSISMRVPLQYLTSHLECMRGLVTDHGVNSKSGTYIGCFALRAGMTQKGWEVLVLKDQPYRLPCVQISPGQLDDATQHVLEGLDGHILGDCIEQLNRITESNDEINAFVAAGLKGQIESLSNLVSEPFFSQAIFSSTALRVPNYDLASGCSSQYDLLAFHVIPDVHISLLKHSTNVTYLPLNFFRCRQKAVVGVVHHSDFESKVHHELSLRYSGYSRRPTAGVAHHRVKHSIFKTWATVARSRANSLGPVRAAPQRPEQRGQRSASHISDNIPFGGIMVNEAVRVETIACKAGEDYAHAGTTGVAEVGATDERTYVDDLCAIAVNSRRVEKKQGRKEYCERDT